MRITIMALKRHGRAEISATPKSGNGSRPGAKDKDEYTVFISGNRKMSAEKLESMCSRFGFALGDDNEFPSLSTSRTSTANCPSRLS